MLNNLRPVLNDGEYTFVEVPHDFDLGSVKWVAAVHEQESLTLVRPVTEAEQAGLAVGFRSAWITLQVDSDLSAVGLTAAVSTAFAVADIPCNVIAGFHHDHLFVPLERAEEALAVLRKLQAEAAT